MAIEPIYEWEGNWRTLVGYSSYHKLKNGQTIGIFFCKQFDCGQDEFRIALAIARKKKHIREWMDGEVDRLSQHQTGTCGLEGLLWAKQQIQAFEDLILSQFHRYRDPVIRVDWTDNRRRDVYAYGLRKLGFQLGYRDNSKCLFKKLTKENES